MGVAESLKFSDGDIAIINDRAHGSACRIFAGWIASAAACPEGDPIIRDKNRVSLHGLCPAFTKGRLGPQAGSLWKECN